MSEQQVDPTLEGLLNSVPTGEELRDPREGDHEDSKLIDVSVGENSEQAVIPFSAVMVWSAMKDSEGRDFDFSARVNIPRPSDPTWVKRMFLQTAHDLGVVPRDRKTALVADTDEEREVLIKILKLGLGQRYPVRIREKNGFVNLTIRRRRS